MPLGWQEGDEITKARVTCLTESAKIASLPDDYITFVQGYDDSDSFLFKYVNMGIPLRTGAAIDSAVHDLLVKAGIEFDICQDDMPAEAAVFDCSFEASVDSSVETWAGLLKYVRSIQLDT